VIQVSNETSWKCIQKFLFVSGNIQAGSINT